MWRLSAWCWPFIGSILLARELLCDTIINYCTVEHWILWYRFQNAIAGCGSLRLGCLLCPIAGAGVAHRSGIVFSKIRPCAPLDGFMLLDPVTVGSCRFSLAWRWIVSQLSLFVSAMCSICPFVHSVHTSGCCVRVYKAAVVINFIGVDFFCVPLCMTGMLFYFQQLV